MFFRTVAAVLFMVTGVAAAAEHGCRDRNGYEDPLLRTLYYYSLLAEAAKTERLPRWQCEANQGTANGAPRMYRADDGDTSWNNAAEQELPACGEGNRPCVRRLKVTELQEDDRWNAIADEFRGQDWHVGVYEPSDGGPEYVVCDSRPSDVMIFMTLSELQVPVDDGHLINRVLRPVIWIVENRLIDEALETVTLRKNNDLSDEEFPEQVTAIRGTNPSRFSQWKASIQDALGQSCVFSLMARVVGDFIQDRGWGYAVTGHSLGGAVAQYIAQQLATPSTARGNFSSFAFNAIGIDVGAGANPSPDILHSFFIEGDPVEALGRLTLGRAQGGRIVRYTPPETDFWSGIAPLENLERHELSSVQRALCDCMNGEGSLSVTPPCSPP